jgi:hypothetical protein
MGAGDAGLLPGRQRKRCAKPDYDSASIVSLVAPKPVRSWNKKPSPFEENTNGMWIRQSVERNTAAVVRQLQSPISGSQPAGAGRWLAADRRIDFRGINLGCVCREEQETRLPKNEPWFYLNSSGRGHGDGRRAS